MTNKDLLKRLHSKEGTVLLESMYGSETADMERQRYTRLVEEISEDAGLFKRVNNLRIFSAPGRTELGGNHTDHNRGRVLAASIQMDAVAVVVPRSDRQVFFRSVGFPDVRVNLDDNNGKSDLAPKPEEQGTTASLVRGIAAEFVRQGVEVRGFSANASNTVLNGSGLSSSAAVEVLIAKIFDGLYGRDRFSAVELAKISQKAENIYFGKPCGLMDQAASACGGAVAIDFADPAVTLVRQIKFDPLSLGFALCVINTRGSHADLTPDYAAIPKEMQAVAGCLGKSYLREASLSQVLSAVGEIRKTTGDRALLRAIHFFNEDNRAEEMAALLEELASSESLEVKRELMGRFLDMVNESGDSSWKLLQNIYSSREPSVQEITLALAVSNEFFRSRKLQAACRVHGGGFAGTIQAYVPVEALEDYRTQMETIFGPGALTMLRIRPVGAVEVMFS
ncbi:MAG: galactokinase [Treponema sp.]|nr:galactokinase [Treponema sp.]